LPAMRIAMDDRDVGPPLACLEERLSASGDGRWRAHRRSGGSNRRRSPQPSCLV
jgi:hypothetical protein